MAIHDEHVGFKVCCLAKLIRREIDSASPAEISENATAITGWVISYLYENREKNVYQKDIEKLFSTRRSTVSNILRLMEEKGLILRNSVEGDARLKKLVLTEKGVDVHRYVTLAIEKINEKIEKNISQEELDAFERTLEKMKANLLDPGC